MNRHCKETQARFDDLRIGNLSASASAEVEEHLASCANCRESLRLLAGVEAVVARAEIDPMTRRRIAVALMRVAPAQTRESWRPRLALLLPAGAAALAATVALLMFHERGAEREDAGSVAPAAAAAVSQGDELALRAEQPVADPALAPPAEALLEQPTEVRPASKETDDVAPTAKTRAGRSSFVRSSEVAAAEVESARQTAVYSARVKEAIREGRLDEARRIVEGEPSGPDEVDLLVSLARAYRRARLFRPAVEVYERLIARHGSTPEAANALVALGQLELDALGRPAAAAERFAEHLRRAPDGFLSEAARVGRVRALQRLGGGAPWEEAVEDYLARHPGGPAAAEVLRLRGEDLAAGGRCDRARDDFRAVLARWPGSRDAKRAAEGMARCGFAPTGD